MSQSKIRLGGDRRGGTERARYWERWLREWERSGLTQAEYCRRHGLKAVNFAWWKRKLAGGPARVRSGRGCPPKRPDGRKGRRGPGEEPTHRASSHDGACPAFIEVAGSPPAAPSYEIILPCGRVIRLAHDFDPDRVTSLIDAVQRAC